MSWLEFQLTLARRNCGLKGDVDVRCRLLFNAKLTLFGVYLASCLL